MQPVDTIQASTKQHSLRRLGRALKYSGAGLIAAWQHETAFREELLLAVVLIPLGLWLGQSGLERAMLIGSIVCVLIIELLNSALEAVVDRISHETHELSGRAKDLGSAAVLLALILAALTWGLIIGPHWL